MSCITVKDAYDAILNDRTKVYVVGLDGEVVDFDEYSFKGIFVNAFFYSIVPGSFNPVHEAHYNMYHYYENSMFEISLERRDKEFLSYEELAKRVKQFLGNAPLIIQQPAKMIEKIANIKNASSGRKDILISIGIDTYNRMVEDYGENSIGGLGASFRVYDRIINGEIVKLERTHHNVFPCRSTEELMKLSSTEIRNKNG